LNEITLAAGIGDGRATSRFIDILTQMQVTAREVPVDERNPQKSRKGLYLIRDSFLRFWFRFVHPNQGILSLA
jgi:AAA+ ATPase superfamily predicted ATPase